MISDRLARIQAEITRICSQLQRNPDEITLVGVTKFAAPQAVVDAVRAGLKHIGENKLQSAREKFAQLEPAGLHVTKHMIGHLQTNKVKKALAVFDMIQSVDSLKLAREIEKEAAKISRAADILVQVNTSGEEQKFGLSPGEAVPLLREIEGLPHVAVKGLMTIAPLTSDEAVIRGAFARTREIFEDLKQQYSGHDRIKMKYLSMGMSNDYRIALEEGANMLRIGSAIFGE